MSLRLLAVVFGAAVAARLAGQLVLGAFTEPEVFEYEEIARSLLAGEGYTYVKQGAVYVASQSSPLYIVLTAAVYAVSGYSAAVMLALQAAAGGLTAALAAWLGARVWSPLSGFLAGVLVALDPGLVVYAAKLHSLTFDALALAAVTCVLVAMPVRPTAYRGAAVGLLIGVCALMRMTALVLLPMQLLWLSRYRRLGLAAASALTIVALLVYAPWPIRNSLLLGQLVPASSESTEWLWRGTNPMATGSSWTFDGRTMFEAADPDFRGRVLAATEAERIGIYRDAAIDYISQRPADALAILFTKIWLFWWPGGTTGLLYPPEWLILYSLWYATIMGLAIWGAYAAVTARDRAVRPLVLLLVLTLAFVSLSQAVFYVEGRHRLAIEPLLLVLTGAGLADLRVRLGSRVLLGRSQYGRLRG